MFLMFGSVGRFLGSPCESAASTALALPLENKRSESLR
jgi:hypothetical protein